MILGMYCNWGVVKFKGEFYISAIHQHYIQTFKERSDCLYLLSKSRESAPNHGHIKLEDVQVIELPHFHSYLGSIRYFFKIVKGLFRLLKLTDFVYLRVPEPFVWVAGILKFFTKTKIHYHYVSFPFEVINSYDESWLKRTLKKFMFYPEYILTAAFSSLNTVSSLGENGVKRLPLFLPKIAQPLYEVSYRKGYESSKFSSEIMDTDTIRFLYVGRLVAGKGLEELLDSTAILYKTSTKDFTLTIAGDGVLREKLENLVINNSLTDVVKFIGPVRFGNDLNKVYTSHDVLISPSYSETGPRTVLEAASNYLYVISTDVGYVRELFCEDDLCTCKLIRPGSTSDLVSALNYVLSNKFLCKEHAELSVKKAQNHTIDDFVDSILGNYYR